MPDPPEKESKLWRDIAMTLLGGAVGIFVMIATSNLGKSPPEVKPAYEQRVVDDITYIKEAMKMIFENQTTMLLYLKMILRKQGIPLD